MRARRGFTLLEVIVVIAVLATLATMVAPNVFRHLGTARDVTARSQIEMLGAALDAFRVDIGRYPTTEEGLKALNAAPAALPAGAWRGPYLRKDVPLDPWGKAYDYAMPGIVNATSFDLQSFGSDGTKGGSGDAADIQSWSSR